MPNPFQINRAVGFALGGSLTLLTLYWVAQINVWTAFFIGAALTLSGIAISISLGLRNGWVPAMLDTLFPSRRQMSEESINHFLEHARETAKQLNAFADAYQQPDNIVASLDELRQRDSRQKRGEMESLMVELKAATDRVTRSVSYAISVSRGKENIGGEDTVKTSQIPTSNTSVETPQSSYQSQPPYPGDPGVDPSVMYRVQVSATNGQTQEANVSGAQIREWVRQGGRQNRDFFVMGLAANTPATPPATPYGVGIY